MPQTEEMKDVDRKERMKLDTITKPYRDPAERIKDFNEGSPGYTPEQAMAEAARCLHCPDPAPCMSNCPLGNEVPVALWYIEQGEFLKAAEVYRLTSPLPDMCGRVCPPENSCATGCVLNKRGKGINTAALEQFAVDYQREHEDIPLSEKAPATGKKVTVVGAGPAGLSCAEWLAVAGHEVVIYEAWPEPGGLLMYGIPNFKLDRGLVRWKIDWLRELGIKFVTGMKVGEDVMLDALIAKEGFDAAFLGTGCGIEASMKIPGEDLKGVYPSIEFLSRANTPQEALPTNYQTPPTIGKRVGVIGGGDTATDCLRTSIRLGADEVVCYYRRSEEEMPGNAKERHHAEEEGAKFEFLTAPVEFLDKDGDGHVDAMKMIRMELGEPDDSGRRRPVPIEGSEHEVSVDAVALAIGYWPDPLMGESIRDLETHNWGLIVVDKETGQTSRSEIFAGGDNVTGPALVGEAAAAGITAAKTIIEFLAK